MRESWKTTLARTSALHENEASAITDEVKVELPPRKQLRRAGRPEAIVREVRHGPGTNPAWHRRRTCRVELWESKIAVTPQEADGLERSSHALSRWRLREEEESIDSPCLRTGERQLEA
eukprot:757895-Hanusia_phi.AAC.5